MNHRKSMKKLSRTPAHRQALLRSLSRALIEHERIETTESKARTLRPFIEKLVTMGMRGQLADRRVAASNLNNDRVSVAKLFNEIAPRFVKRKADHKDGISGGYTRIIKLRNRRGDNAPLAIIEFVERGDAPSANE